MTREDFNGKNYQEIEPMLAQDLNEYKENVNQMMTMQELMDAEKVLMEEAQKYDEYLNTVEYDLPERVEFDGENYSRNQVAVFIINSLNKNEVEWSQTLGLYELMNLWRNKNLAKIANKVYDSTLRVLNQVKYKGYNEWVEILIVNKFLSSCHNEYSLDTAYNILLSEKHNALLDRAKLIEKAEGVVDENEVVMQQE